MITRISQIDVVEMLQKKAPRKKLRITSSAVDKNEELRMEGKHIYYITFRATRKYLREKASHFFYEYFDISSDYRHLKADQTPPVLPLKS